MSSYNLSQDEVSLLDRGLLFIPSPIKYSSKDFLLSSQRLIRRLKLFDYFKDRDDQESYNPAAFHNRFNAPSTWVPPSFSCSKDTLAVVSAISDITNQTLYEHTDGYNGLFIKNVHNLPPEERHAIYALRQNQDIIIKSADKGGAVVIMQRSLYVAEAIRQLRNTKYYVKIPESLSAQNCSRITSIVCDLYDKKYITHRQRDYLLPQSVVKPRRFYLLPKIHKARHTWPMPFMPPGRPIVSCCGTELHPIGKFIDFFLQPFRTRNPAFIKDTYDFINKIRGQVVEPHFILVTGDVSSLYTNMDKDIILSTIKNIFHNNPDPSRPDQHILDLLELSLEGNDFIFENEWFRQILGMAMGNPCAPSAADLFLEKIDRAAMLVVLLYFRFLDDIFFLWPGTLEQLTEFNNFINTLIPNISITFTAEHQQIDFLDVTIFKHMENGVCTLHTKPYFKDTDTHQLVPTDSFHPRHMFKGIIKSQFLRLKRLSSFKCDYDSSARILCKVLRTRGYSNRLLRSTRNTIWYNNFVSNGATNNSIPIVVRYNSIGTLCAAKYKRVIQNSNPFRNIRLITAYTVHRNLGSMLSHATGSNSVSNDLNLYNSGCFKCPSIRCKSCNFLIDTRYFVSHITGKKFLIRQHINCKSKNVIYLIDCKKCHMQYVGETGRFLGERICDHLSCIRLNKTTPVSIHFNSKLHNINDFNITGIEMFNNSDSSHRKSRELFWQHVLKTIHPMGINNSNTYNNNT